MKNLNIKVIGLGGIGSVLVDNLCRFINYSMEKGTQLLLIDGDSYESKNIERQNFVTLGNKAEVKAKALRTHFENISFKSYPNFITEENWKEIIGEYDIIFLAVDNHKTRKLVSDCCDELQNVVLISGGNDLTDGNVQIYIKRGGQKVTPNLSDYHPEIRTPEDKLPTEMSCEELSISEPQLFYVNLGVATFMCWAFYNVVVKKEFKYSEVYFDMLTLSADSKIRTVKGV